MEIIKKLNDYYLWKSEYKEYVMEYIDCIDDGFPILKNFKDWIKWQLSLEKWGDSETKELKHLLNILEAQAEIIECPSCKYKFYIVTNGAIKLYEENEQLKSSNSTLLHSFTYYAERCVSLEKEIEIIKNKD